eukprot:s1601_g4.t1
MAFNPLLDEVPDFTTSIARSTSWPDSTRRQKQFGISSHRLYPSIGSMRPSWQGAVRWSSAGAALPETRQVLRARHSVAVRLAKDPPGEAARPNGMVAMRPEMSPRVAEGKPPVTDGVQWTKPSHPHFQGVSPRIPQQAATTQPAQPALQHPQPRPGPGQPQPLQPQLGPGQTGPAGQPAQAKMPRTSCPGPAGYACTPPRPILSSAGSAEAVGHPQAAPWARPPELHMRLFSLEQSMQELRADMERRSTELFQQVDSLAKTVQRLDAQVAGHNERSAETQAAGANSCSLEQLRQVVSLTLVELENLTRRANDAFDRSASSSIKQIQELQQLAGNVALRGLSPSNLAQDVCQPESGILEVVMNKGMNAMSARFVRELHQILDVLQYPVTAPADEMTVVRVLILRGEGAAFCAGYDFKDPSNNKANQPFLQNALSGVIKKLRETLGLELLQFWGQATGDA